MPHLHSPEARAARSLRSRERRYSFGGADDTAAEKMLRKKIQTLNDDLAALTSLHALLRAEVAAEVVRLRVDIVEDMQMRMNAVLADSRASPRELTPTTCSPSSGSATVCSGSPPDDSWCDMACRVPLPPASLLCRGAVEEKDEPFAAQHLRCPVAAAGWLREAWICMVHIIWCIAQFWQEKWHDISGGACREIRHFGECLRRYFIVSSERTISMMLYWIRELCRSDAAAFMCISCVWLVMFPMGKLPILQWALGLLAILVCGIFLAHAEPPKAISKRSKTKKRNERERGSKRCARLLENEKKRDCSDVPVIM